MPGILPMKVIKVGSSCQPRIAQACDRCRSKKIRCDGIRPSCTQCLNVGFECKTSDKLSRRAFPRGYTESLEEQVRSLEAEVKELKSLLDEKDEKIDMLSRIRSRSTPLRSSQQLTDIASASPTDSTDHIDDSETFNAMQPAIIDDGQPRTLVFGASSRRPMLHSLNQRILESRTSTTLLNEENISTNMVIKTCESPDMQSLEAPGRMMTDRLVNIFFQEFAPLFPILHRPTFLALYEKYDSCAGGMQDTKALAQLNLVFGISALSSQLDTSPDDIQKFEAQWQASLETFSTEESLTTLQCLCLAILYFMAKGDYSQIMKYKGHAVGLSQRLGLALTQNYFNFDVLMGETRKKVFWSLYTLDRFSAAHLGLPVMICDNDVQCEYPVDVDDEYIADKQILPSLPGESTKISSALALFKLARVLSKILKDLYPAKTGQLLSFKTIASLQDELDTWSSELAPHLRLHFEKDKPSTGIIHSRAPLLLIAYFYAHTLISRPAVSASTLLQSRSNPSILSLASSSKRIIQIALLLAERKLTFSFCLNEREMLQESMIGLLFQALALGPRSAVFREDWKLMMAACDRLESHTVLGSCEFRELISNLANEGKQMTNDVNIIRESRSNPIVKFVESKRLETLTSKVNSRRRQKTLAHADRRTYPYSAQPSQADASFLGRSTLSYQAPLFTRSELRLSPMLQRVEENMGRCPTAMNLDYLALSMPNRSASIPLNHTNRTDGPKPTDWNKLLSALDNGKDNIHDGTYGGSRCQPPSLGDYSSLASSSPKVLNSASGIDATANLDIFAQQSCSPSELWTSISDFSISSPYFVPQRGVTVVPEENNHLKLGSGTDIVSFQPEVCDDQLSRKAPLANENSPLATGTLGDADLFGIDLNLI